MIKSRLFVRGGGAQRTTRRKQKGEGTGNQAANLWGTGGTESG